MDDSDFPTKLLHYGLSFLDQPKPIIHAESSSLVSTIVKKEGRKVYAGDLILAKDTVCYLGELAKYKKDSLENLKSGTELLINPSREQIICSHENFGE